MNDDTNAASQGAAAGNPAPESAPAASTKSTSRFYSRMRRGNLPAAPAVAAASSEPVALESLSAEQAALLKDHLPVRATMPPGSEATGFGGPRDDRPPREGFDRDRRGGRDRERGPGRDREREGGGRDRERFAERPNDRGPAPAGKFDRDRDRPRLDDRDRAPDATTPVADAAPAPLPPEIVPAPRAESIERPAPNPSPEAPRKLRFEDAPAHGAQRTVQEFRPSHDRDFGKDAERARAERERREIAPTEKSPGLFGWMKSMFVPKPEGGETAAEPAREPARDRGSRPPRPGQGPGQADRQGQGHGQGQGQGPGFGGGGQGPGAGDGRRRRRRRGGRNRNRGNGPDGGGGGQGGGGGGGDSGQD